VIRLADDAERATNAADHTTAVVANRAFHQAIDALADNPVSAAAGDRLWDRILVSTARSLVVPGRGDIVNREHRDLLAAIGAGDGERAADIAVRHVRATLDAAHPLSSS
jgi:DNA-binding GntR family transcriptional regulator